MAITAKFTADFSNFIDAVNKAEVELKEIGDAAFNVQTKLVKMVDTFSGRKLIQEAIAMATAIEQAGGATVLTAKELAVVSAKAAEAADKLHRLGYEVPPGIQKLADATKKASDETGGLAAAAGSAVKVLGAFGVVASAAALVSFGKSILEGADALVKLHDKTGITIGNLQLLQAAGDDAGNTLDEITSAVTKLQVKIGGGDSGALGALAHLGISFEKFRQLSPDQQFIEIGNAIAKIQDPADQAKTATLLFGKAGAEVLPTLKHGFDELKDSVNLMSDETVVALDRAGDALAALWRREKGIVSGIAGDIILRAKADVDSLRILFGALPDIPKAPNLPINQPLGLQLGLKGNEDQIVKDLTESIQKSQKAFKDAGEAAKKFRESVEALSFKKFVVDSIPMVGLIQDISDRSGAFREHLDDLTSSWNEYHDGITVAGDEMATVTIPLFSKLPNVIAQNTKALEKADESVGGFGATFHTALGGIDKILSGVNNAFAQTVVVAARAADQISQVFSKGLSNLAKGDWISVIATGIAAVGSLFGKLFSNPEKQINPVRQAFVDAAGGLAELNKQAHDAGLTLDHLLDAKNPEQYQKAIEELNAAFQFQDTAMSKLNETVQKYGFSIEELGPALQRQNLDEQAQTLYQDFQLLTAAGIDHTAVLTRMADGVNAYVQNAQALGIEVPASLEPVLQQMADLGLLTDKSGNKIENLQDSGITFSQTMTQGFKSIVDAVEKLANAITGKLNPAIKNIPTDVTVGVHYNYDDFRSPDVIPMATGGMGRVTKPTLFLAGEKGPENFAFGDSVGGGNGATQSVLYDILAALRDQPRQIRDAVLLAG